VQRAVQVGREATVSRISDHFVHRRADGKERSGLVTEIRMVKGIMPAVCHKVPADVEDDGAELYVTVERLHPAATVKTRLITEGIPQGSGPADGVGTSLRLGTAHDAFPHFRASDA
jgi:hypothetical protein